MEHCQKEDEDTAVDQAAEDFDGKPVVECAGGIEGDQTFVEGTVEECENQDSSTANVAGLVPELGVVASEVQVGTAKEVECVGPEPASTASQGQTCHAWDETVVVAVVG